MSTVPCQGVCTPWATSDDLCVPCTDDLGLAPALVDECLWLASDTLFQLTGRQWPGACQETVRPCGCSAHRGCRCRTSQEWRLPNWPVIGVSEVLVDGAVLASSAYRVDARRWLVRTDGDGWYTAQDLRLDSTEVGTWQVTYVWGRTPPRGGVRAAAALACELVIACTPDLPCGSRLPTRVTSITRQGVSMAVLDPLTLFEEGRTGLPEVDAWIGSVRWGNRHRAGSVVVAGTSPAARRTGA